MPDLFWTTWQEVVGNRRKIYNFEGVSNNHYFTFWNEKKKENKKEKP